MSRAPLQPWREQPSSADPVEAEAMRLAREMPPAEALSPEAAARISAKLGALPPPRGARLPRGLMMLGVGVLGVAAALAFGLSRPAKPPTQSRAERTVEAPKVAAPTPRAPEPVAPPVLPPPARPEVTSAPPPPPTRREARPENALLEEAKLLGKAVEQLRREQNPKAALATLQRYFSRYPRGELRGEAEVTRVEALLGSGRSAEALTHLEQLSRSGFAGLPRPLELALQRAQLLADAGRAPEATRAFSEVLAQHPAPALEERALFGRAVCRARAGDEEGMRADLEEYLRRFPDGRFAAEARERLKPERP